MEIHVDYNPTPKNHFFIAAHINDKKCISFDCTYKGHRIVEQKLVDKKSFPEKNKLSGEWDTVIIKDGYFNKRYHVRWVDMDERDWLNEEVWETVWEKPISNELTKQLLHFSQLISDNYEHLEKYRDEMKTFEQLLQTEINKVS